MSLLLDTRRGSHPVREVSLNGLFMSHAHCLPEEAADARPFFQSSGSVRIFCISCDAVRGNSHSRRITFANASLPILLIDFRSSFRSSVPSRVSVPVSFPLCTRTIRVLARMWWITSKIEHRSSRNCSSRRTQFELSEWSPCCPGSSKQRSVFVANARVRETFRCLELSR